MKNFILLAGLLFSTSTLAANNSVVTIETPLGSFRMELLEGDAPKTVQNFLNYVERGAYDGTFFHRSVPGFVIQGGGFAYDPNSNTAPAITVDPPVENEFGVSNIRGTVAMAKTAAGPDTATSQWFVNLADNSANLDNQNGGFTVFARVIGDGMTVVDAIAALPRANLDGGGVFASVPTINFTNSINASIFVTIDSASVESQPDFDNDGIPDDEDADDDNDGVPDVSDAFSMDPAEFADTDNDGTGDNADTDDDGDGVPDTEDAFPLDNQESKDSDGDGIGDNADTAMRLTPDTVIELPIVGAQFSSSTGAELTVPANATAASLNVTVVNPDSAGFITVWPCGVARPNASNLNYVAGDVVPNGVLAALGTNGSVCFYSQAPADLIVDVAGWFEGDAFTGATPQRLVDTRDGTGGQQGQLLPGNALMVQATGISASTAAGSATTVPSTAGTVALNLTVVNPAAPGFVTAYPCDAERPLASNVNYIAGQVVANGVIAPVSSTGQVCLFSSAATDIIVDLAGWFPGNTFTGATPKRLVDTRVGTGTAVGKLTPAGQLSLPARGAVLSVGGQDSEIPSNAAAAALNVTVVNPEAAGFVTVWPCSAERPNASNLNFVAGQTVANNVVAPIGDAGNVCFFASQDTDLIVDVSGFFTPDSSNQFIGTAPKRLVDTRTGTGPTPQ